MARCEAQGGWHKRRRRGRRKKLGEEVARRERPGEEKESEARWPGAGDGAGGGSARGRQRPHARALGVGKEARARRGGADHWGPRERAITTKGRGRAEAAPPQSPGRPAAPGSWRRGLGGRQSGQTLLSGSLPSVRPSGRTSLPAGCVSGPSRLPPVGHRSTPPALPLPCRLVFLPVLFVPGLPVFPACPGS